MTASIQSARFIPLVRTCASLALLGALTLALGACGNNAPQNAATPAAQKPGVPASSTQAQVQAQAEQAAQAKLESMSVEQLLSSARTAMNQQRLVAPKGDNAFEYYEKALQKDPKNQVAQDALRESFPFGANAVEAAIGQNNFDEAQR